MTWSACINTSVNKAAQELFQTRCLCSSLNYPFSCGGAGAGGRGCAWTELRAS